MSLTHLISPEVARDLALARKFLACGRCGLERDSTGWCPNYCMDGDPPLQSEELSSSKAYEPSS